MSNTYFQFKQFRINQINSAMKVGTDGVLLGSWCNVSKAKSVLDIGCGTGLIALMVAQRNATTSITAIDISEHAITDCEENFSTSPWKHRLMARQIALQDFERDPDNGYDLIVSNPPFFNKSLKSDLSHKNLARHDDSLPFEELFALASKLLDTNGLFALIIPHDRRADSIKHANAQNLSLIRECVVFPKQESEIPKRVLQEFAFANTTTIHETLHIEQERHIYTQAYKEMTGEFYLKS